MTEEDGDFLDGVIEFGDGKQYNVAPTPVDQSGEEEVPSGDRLGNDFDRSWPASNGMQPPPLPGSSPTVSPLTSTNPQGERVLFNERHNRMEPMPARQAPTTPTLLHAHPSPQTLRAGVTRRESDGRGFREPPAWNAPSQRSTYATSEASDRQGDSRHRRPSASDRDKSYASGGLGPHLRDRSPDGSGRFPGRNIQRMARRDSQASSGIVPSAQARSTRALSRESSDRGSGIRQLPPHLSATAPAAHAPSLVTGSVTGPSISSRASWRGSPTDIRSPAQAPQTPSVIHSEAIQPNANPENGASTAPPVESSEQDAVANLMNDEAALKAAMAVAAERARKRRLEEEELRMQEIERAKKKKLANLEAKMQAEKETKEKALKEAEEQIRKEKEEAERLVKQEAEHRAKEKEKERATQVARMPPPSRPPMPSDTVNSWRGSAPARPSISTQAPPQGRRLTNGSARSPTDSKRSPTVILKQKHFEHPPQASPVAPSKPAPVDLSGKPANSAVIAEVAALQSKTMDDSVQVLHFSDLRQLAEGYGQTLSAPVVNGTEPLASVEQAVPPKSPTETRPTRPYESGPPQHSPVSTSFDEHKSGRAQKSKPPSSLNFVARGSQDHGAPNGPVSAGLSPSWSPRTQEYRQAPISVIDDTLSRFKMAIMHSNPEHAGMSSDDIIQGLGRTGVEPEKGARHPSKFYPANHLSAHIVYYLVKLPTQCPTDLPPVNPPGPKHRPSNLR